MATRRRRTLLVAALLASAVATTARGSTAPFTVFAKAGPARTSGTAVLEHVRVARHLGFDRIVFEFRDETPAWRAAYVPKIVQDPSGRAVTVGGRAFLRIVFQRTRVDRARAGSRIVRTPGFPTLVQAKEAGDFEGVVSFGLGARRRVGFRALHLSAPGRIALDLSH